MGYSDRATPRFFAHRGGASEAPENTLEAFHNGIGAGADHLELDVHGTSDGEIVVIHDPTLDRTTNATGPVKARSLAELRELDAGYRFEDPQGEPSFRGRGVRIPTLGEVCEAFPEVPLNMEIKQAEPDIITRVLDVLARHDALERSLLAAEHGSLMEKIREHAGGVLFGYSTEDVIAFLQAVDGGKLDSYTPVGFALQVPSEFLGTPLVTPEFIAAAHAKTLEVHVWTVDEEDEMQTLLDMGVDGLMTDRPSLLADVFRRRAAKS